MPIIFRKGAIATGGPTRVRPNPMTATPRPPFDITTLYISLEDNSDWLVTESDDPLIVD